MRACTEAVHLSAPAEAVWQFVSDPESLPAWAAGFCRGIAREGERWIADTAHGPVAIEFLADPSWLTVDFRMTGPDGSVSRAWSRVVGEAEESVYGFTFFASPGETAEGFAARSAALREELRILAARFRARRACDAA